MIESILGWIGQYGYVALFSLLVLGIVGLPIPDETILLFAGYLASTNKFQLPATFFTAFVGSISGITLSYLIGRNLGFYLVNRYGRFLSITKEKIDRVHEWFRRNGKWTLVIGYFIPGVRHLTAYIAGATKLEFKVFAAFAYCGGILWSTCFILIGYLVGDQWESMANEIRGRYLFITLAVIIAFVVVVVFRKMKSRTLTK